MARKLRAAVDASRPNIRAADQSCESRTRIVHSTGFFALAAALSRAPIVAPLSRRLLNAPIDSRLTAYPNQIISSHLQHNRAVPIWLVPFRHPLPKLVGAGASRPLFFGEQSLAISRTSAYYSLQIRQCFEMPILCRGKNDTCREQRLLRPAAADTGSCGRCRGFTGDACRK